MAEKYRSAPILPFYRRADRGPASPRTPQQVSDRAGFEATPPGALSCAPSGLPVFVPASASDSPTEVRSGAGQAAAEGRNCLPTLSSIPSNPTHPRHVSQISSTPLLDSQSPHSGKEAVGPHPQGRSSCLSI